MGAWNAFEWPLVVLSNENLYPLTVGLALFRDNNTQDWPRILAAGVMGSLPLIALFYLAQRFLTEGISLRYEILTTISGSGVYWFRGCVNSRSPARSASAPAAAPTS